MKFKQRVGRHESNSGQICSVCFHAVSNHYVMIDTKSKSNKSLKLHSCTKCKCRKCAW